MAWPDEQPNEWDMELQRMRYVEALGFPSTTNVMDMPPFYETTTSTSPSGGGSGSSAAEGMNDVSMTRPAAHFNHQHAAPHNNHHQTLTYSASCPSFTALYELSSDDDLIRDIQRGGVSQQQRANGFMTGNMTNANQPLHHPSHVQELQDPAASGLPSALAEGKHYDFLLQMQQEHLDANLRQYPHQQTHVPGDHFAVFNQPRRPLHASASFTSLSSMETEYRRQSASKRKKGGERWYKQQRHKSFDSTTTTAPSPATSMEFSSYSGASSQFESTPEHHFLEETPDTDMIGFSIDDFPSTFTSDASWPMPLTLGGGVPFEAYNTDDSAATDLLSAMPPAPLPEQQQQQQAEAASGDKASNSADSQSPADIDLLLSDQERANMSSLFDAIRDFEVPPVPVDSSKSTQDEPQRQQQPPRNEKRSAKKKTLSPPLHPSRPRRGSMDRKNDQPFSLLSTSAPASVSFMKIPEREAAFLSLPPAGQQRTDQSAEATLSVKERIQKVLSKSQSHDARTPLTDFEQSYLEISPLFLPGRSSETAGSLWLILHAAHCEFGCDIAGCNVMRRVLKHCVGCDVVVGKCKDPCNEAKTMILHFGSCRNTDTHPCAVCRKLKEIDQAHNALRSSPRMAGSTSSAATVSASTPPFMAIPMSTVGGMGRVPIAPQPKVGSAPALRPAHPGSKHVPIQPNPLPTSSNPMGLMGSFPHFGYSLSLYLEQTSVTFRAEVKARVEKRVTSAAGQDLIQHMQKKTRLRSLDDLRSEARTLVLGELERELHFHMQAYSWASANNNDDNHLSTPTNSPHVGGTECALPPYLLSVAAAGFAAFYAQQASFHAAMTGMGSSPSTSKSSSAPFSSTPPVARRKASIGSMPSTSSSGGIAASSSAAKKTALSGPDKSKEPALAV